MRPARRAALRTVLAAGIASLAGCSTQSRGPERGPFTALVPASFDREGALEDTLAGIRRVESELGVVVRVIRDVPAGGDALLATLRDAARPPARMVIGFGAPIGAAMQRVAWERPDQRFTLVDGDPAVLRPNLAIYEVLETQAVWLAGVAAGLTSRTGIVGILPDAPVAAGDPPGRVASADIRDAFAGGVREGAPAVRLVDAPDGGTGAPGVAALAARGADTILLLSRAPSGAVLDAVRERRIRCVGLGRDWTRAEPELFVAAAVRDPGQTVLAILRDLDDAVWRGDIVRRLGVRSAALRVTLAPDVPARAQNVILDYRDQILAGRFQIPGVAPRFAGVNR